MEFNTLGYQGGMQTEFSTLGC